MNHLDTSFRFPLATPLRNGITPEEVFVALNRLPGRVWFDSSTGWPNDRQRPVDERVRGLSRYSFISADPITNLRRSDGDASPWDQLSRLSNWLPTDYREGLPPFQGGLAGLLGYEAARWLPELELEGSFEHQIDDCSTPACALGLYDWVIGFDHLTGEAWLVCQGIMAEDVQSQTVPCDLIRRQQALERSEQIQSLLSASSLLSAPRPVEIRETSDGCGHATPLCGLRSDFTSQGYRDVVAEIVERIRAGDSFQVNVAQRLSCDWSGEPEELYRRLRAANPAPFSAFYDGGDFQVLSSSPERFLSVRRGLVQTRPIKGTTARTGDATRDDRLAEELLRSEKDRAENTMIVDLMRNDFARVCRDDSVVVKQLCRVERYQFVQHLVSVVEGHLREDVGTVDLLRACFPGGSVTGAPKTEAMRTIAAMEPHPRGPYCGTIGYIGCGGQADFNILIRTLTAAKQRLHFQVGGGITARSMPESEEAETWTKAEGMLRAILPGRSSAKTQRDPSASLTLDLPSQQT